MSDASSDLYRPRQQAGRRVPVFALYGDMPGESAPGFVHVERIPDRAQRYGWTIGTHRHRDLAQAILVETGHGKISIDDTLVPFSAPWFIWLPTGVVHALHFEGPTTGHVVTISEDFIAAIASRAGEEPRLRAAAAQAFCEVLPQASEVGIDIAAQIRAVAREVRAARPSASAAVGAHLHLVLIALMRLQAATGTTEAQSALRSSIYRRFRQLVESHFREHRSVARYAADLGVTPDRLHAISVAAVGMPPSAVLHERLILEAKRDLIYTARTVGEIAFDLGFEDAAYFSRFFRRRTGQSAVAYRKAHAAAG